MAPLIPTRQPENLWMIPELFWIQNSTFEAAAKKERSDLGTSGCHERVKLLQPIKILNDFY
jgi:hypothetical protein